MKLHLRSHRTHIVFAALCAVSISPTQGFSAEKLANPFGGHPPEYSPSEEHHTNWTFKLEGWKRNFTIGTSNPMGKSQRRSSYTIHSGATSPDKKYYCALEPNVVVTTTGFSISKDIAGCWKIIGQSKYRNLGGYPHGQYSCRFTNKKAKTADCIYTSAKNGKKYKIRMKAEVLGW